MAKMNIITLLYFILVLAACGKSAPEKQLLVENKLSFDRNEIVAIERNTLDSIFKGKDLENIMIFDPTASNYQVTQLVDTDIDGTFDELLFQANVKAYSTAIYKLEYKENAKGLKPEEKTQAYSRFVPERTDDYTWENDRVAFRTYGPVAERMVREGRSGGTLSSGIDLWLKRVHYPIIDKWYSENLNHPGYYHIDHGEGYDPYHVGASRGTGGSGVWQADSLSVSGNFIAYRTICAGPLRTIFELDYAPWSRFNITETKRVSLDAGSNFSKFEIRISGDFPKNSYAIGITLHDGKGEPAIDKETGMFLYWEPIDGEFVGEGLIFNPESVSDAFLTNSNVPDQNQLLVTTNARNKLVYYAGFAWTRSKQIASKGDWVKVVNQQKKVIECPLSIKFE